MNVENDTDREVEYEQTGTGAGVRGGSPCRGKLGARQSKTFDNCDGPNWLVVFIDRKRRFPSRPLAEHERDHTVRFHDDGSVSVHPPA